MTMNVGFRALSLSIICCSILGLQGCNDSNDSTNVDQITKPNLSDQAILDMSLVELRTALDNGQLSAEYLTQVYLDQIDKNDKKGMKINAISTLNPNALSDAKAWDLAQKKDPLRKNAPLSGIPFLVKDNYNTKGLLTTGGSVGLDSSIPTSTAFVVEKVLDQGGILLGKTNMSELAASYGRLGYSSFGGQTLNPWNLKRDASGSSSGSAAALAAKFAPYAFGSDTGGSIRGPASVTGTVGLRPSMGLISRSGVIPLSLSADTTGIFTRDVQDQAIVLNAIQGPDPLDSVTLNTKIKLDNFENYLIKDALKGKTIGVITNFAGDNAEVDALRVETEQKLRLAGATVTYITLPEVFNDLWSAVLGPVGHAEFKSDFEAYLLSLDTQQPKTLSAFIDLIEAKQAQNIGFGINPRRMNGLITDNNVTPEAIAEAKLILEKTVPELRAMFDQIMTDNQIDSFLLPTMTCPASVVYTEKDPDYECTAYDEYAPGYIASSLGYPEITFTVGTAKGNAPVGMSFLGSFNDDYKVLSFAYAFTQLK